MNNSHFIVVVVIFVVTAIAVVIVIVLQLITSDIILLQVKLGIENGTNSDDFSTIKQSYRMSNRTTLVWNLAAQLSKFLFNGRMTAANRDAVTTAITQFLGNRVLIVENTMVLNAIQPLRLYMADCIRKHRDAKTSATQIHWSEEVFRTAELYEQLVGERPTIVWRSHTAYTEFLSHPVDDITTVIADITGRFGAAIDFVVLPVKK